MRGFLINIHGREQRDTCVCNTIIASKKRSRGQGLIFLVRFFSWELEKFWWGLVELGLDFQGIFLGFVELLVLGRTF
jgi:hypothetical protein